MKHFLAYGSERDGKLMVHCIVCGRTRTLEPICSSCERKAPAGVPQLIQHLSPALPNKRRPTDKELVVTYSEVGRLVSVSARE